MIHTVHSKFYVDRAGGANIYMHEFDYRTLLTNINSIYDTPCCVYHFSISLRSWIICASFSNLFISTVSILE